MEKRFDVVVVGELNVDLIMNRIDKFPIVGKEVLAQDMDLLLGSSSAIFASNISTLGASVTFIGKLGKDGFGDFVLQNLSEKSVHTGNIIIDERGYTGVTVVLNFGNDRAMVTSPGAMNSFALTDIGAEKIMEARHLHISSIYLQQGLRKDVVALLKAAKALGLTTSVDPQWDPLEKWDVDLPALLSYTDIFLPNMSELMAQTRTRNSSETLEYIKDYDNTIVVKDGIRGAYLWDGKSLLHQPAFVNSHAIDAIGAGDSFDAGFVIRYLEGASWEECLRFGTLTGAVSTTAAGGTGAFSSIDSVKQVAKAAFNYSM